MKTEQTELYSTSDMKTWYFIAKKKYIFVFSEFCSVNSKIKKLEKKTMYSF